MFCLIDKRISNREPLKIWCCSLLSLLILGLFSYGYFVRNVTVNIVARQNMEDEISTLSSKVLALESEYLKVKNQVTPELAESLGFVAATNQKFVTKDVQTPGLSLAPAGL